LKGSYSRNEVRNGRSIQGENIFVVSVEISGIRSRFLGSRGTLRGILCAARALLRRGRSAIRRVMKYFEDQQMQGEAAASK